MSWRERSAWISLLSTVVIFAVYFWWVAGQFGAEVTRARPLLLAFLAAGIIYSVIVIALQLASGLVFGLQAADERDNAIAAKAARIAYYFLLTCIYTGFTGIALLAAIQAPSAQGTVLLPTFSFVTQAVLFLCISAEVLRCTVTVVCYRRGA